MTGSPVTPFWWIACPPGTCAIRLDLVTKSAGLPSIQDRKIRASGW